MRFIFIYYLLIGCTSGLFSQQPSENSKNHSSGLSLFHINYSYQIPGKDMAKRFYNNSSLGVGFLRKTKHNWCWGMELDFFFRDKVKQKNIFDSIATQNNQIIDGNGQYADISLYERGYNAFIKAGKIIPLTSKNKNSGLLFTIGLGFMEHKIKIHNSDNSVPQINKDYQKGYDHLTNGIAFTEFIGYLFISPKSAIRFYAGIEMIQALTRSRRSIDFITQTKDIQRRTDLLNGIKAGLIIPLNLKKKNNQI